MKYVSPCAECDKWPLCTLMPDECVAESISEDELVQKGEINGTFGESLDW